MGEIVDIIAREIIDSRVNPSVEFDALLDSAASGSTSKQSRANCNPSGIPVCVLSRQKYRTEPVGVTSIYY